MAPKKITLQQRLARLPVRYRWTLHNLVGHPLSEVLHLAYLPVASDWVHNVTIPEEVPHG